MNLAFPLARPKLRALLASRLVLPVTLLGAILLGWAGWQGWRAVQAGRSLGAPASAEVIEAEWGIQITQVAVTAAGGLVDFRFRVIDPDKAGPLFTLAKRPVLIAEDTGAVVSRLMHPPHSHDLVPGRVSYLIYNNTGGALRRGATVSVVLGDLRLEHLVVK